MDKQERILKFLLGRAISRLDYDEAKANYESALANATDDQKAQASAYLQSVLNHQSANPKSNKHARHTGAEAYRIATTMLNGTFDLAAVQSPLGTTGIDTRRQDYATAGNVAADFMRQNANRKQSTGTSVPGSSAGRYFFNAMDGLNPLGEQIGATRGSLVKSYAQGLLKNISDAQSAEKSGKTVYNKINGMYDDIANLLAIINGDAESDQAYNTLLSIAGKYDTADHWRSYFGDLLPMSSELEKRKAALMRENGLTEYDLSDQSEWGRNLGKKYKFFKDRAGNIRAYNNDYTEQIKDIIDYNSNFNDRNIEGKGFGHGFIADSEGNIYLGDTKAIGQDSPFYSLWNKRLAEDRTNRDNTYWDIDYQFGKDDTGNSPWLQALEKKFGSFKGSDVSSLFQGNDKIFATGAAPGQSYYDKDDYFGGITFNNNAKFYKVGDNGEIEEVSWDNLKDKFNQNGWEGEGQELLGQKINLDQYLNEAGESNIDLNSDMGGRTFWTALLEAYGLDSLTPAALGGILGGIAGANGVEWAGEKIGNKNLMSYIRKGALNNLAKQGIKEPSEKMLRKEMFKVGQYAIGRAVKSGALKGALKTAGVKGGLRLGIQGTLASTGIGALIGAALGGTEAGIRYANYDNINEDIPGFVHNLLGAVANHSGQLHTKLHGVHNNAQLLLNLDYNNQKSEYTKFLFQLFNENPDLWNSLSKEEKNTFIAMKRDFNRNYKSTVIEKEGGIIKAARGTVLDPSGEPLGDFVWQNPDRLKAQGQIANLREAYRKSNEKGYGDDIYRKQASETGMFKGNGKMSTADALRISTMAQDAASIVASFVPGAGTGVAAGLGVTALGTDLAADVLDPAVTAGEVAKNALVNAGFAGLGMIPGAKVGKVAKNIIKYLPKIVTAAAGLGIAMDESTQATFKKLGDGTTKLNREDWRNISHVLSLVAAGTRGVKGDIARYKVKKGIVPSESVKITGTDKVLSKALAESINEKLSKVAETKEGEKTISAKENAIKILTDELQITPEQAASILKTPKGVGKAKIGKYSIDVTEMLDANNSYDNLRAIWNNEASDVEGSSKWARWFANKIGGGEYTAKQRAILENLADDKVANLMDYKGNYNPMIDWKNLRQNAATKLMKQRYVSPETKDNREATLLALPEYKAPAPEIEKRNSNVEQAYKRVEDIMKRPENGKRVGKGKNLLSDEKIQQLIAPMYDGSVTNPRMAIRRINLTIDYLKTVDDPRAAEMISQLTALRSSIQKAIPTTTLKVESDGQLQFPFKQGGQINYSKLRK